MLLSVLLPPLLVLLMLLLLLDMTSQSSVLLLRMLPSPAKLQLACLVPQPSAGSTCPAGLLFADATGMHRSTTCLRATALSEHDIWYAGTFSGLMQTAITTPTELLKIRLQLQTYLPGHPAYVGPIRLLRQVAMREGITGKRSFIGIAAKHWPLIKHHCT